MSETENPIGYDLEALEIYILPTDQPATCPKCGARTDFEDYSDWGQLHRCLDPRCDYEFIGEVVGND